MTDVTASVQYLGNPAETFSAANGKSPAWTYARNVWDLYAHTNGKLYIGSGNSASTLSFHVDDNAGPVKVLVYDPSSGGSFSTQGLSGGGTLAVEQIDRFLIVDGKLVIPCHDVHGTDALIWHEESSGVWTKVTGSTDGIAHVFDIEAFEGTFYAALGLSTAFSSTSVYAKATFFTASGWASVVGALGYGPRVYDLVVFGGDLYSCCEVGTSGGSNPGIYRLASGGSTFSSVTGSTFSGMFASHSATGISVAKMYRPTVFGSALVYIGAQVYNDEQELPFGLFTTAALYSGSVLGTITEIMSSLPHYGSGEVPWDFLDDGAGTLYILTSYTSGSDKVVAVVSTTDLSTFTEVFSFIPNNLSGTGLDSTTYSAAQTHAHSFERIGSTWYFGLGSIASTSGTQPANVGAILSYTPAGAVLAGTSSFALSASADLTGGAVAGSAYVKDALLTWLKGTTFPSAPATVYVSLHTGPPGKTGASEVSASGTAYARVAMSTSSPGWSAISDGAGTKRQISNAGAITFPSPSGSNWGTCTHFGIWDASSTGNHIVNGALTSSRVINAGDGAPGFAIGALVADCD